MEAPVRCAATAPLSGDEPRELSARIGRCAVGGRHGFAGFVSADQSHRVDRLPFVAPRCEVGRAEFACENQSPGDSRRRHLLSLCAIALADTILNVTRTSTPYG